MHTTIRPCNVSKCLLPYSAKFSRRIIFMVFADLSGTTKMKLLETFRLNFSGVRGIVWKQYDSYSTFAVLRGRQALTLVAFVNGEASPAQDA